MPKTTSTDRLIDEVSAVLETAQRLLISIAVGKGYADLYSIKTENDSKAYLLYMYIFVLQLWLDENYETPDMTNNSCIIRILERITCIQNTVNCTEDIEFDRQVFNENDGVFGGTIPHDEVVLKLADGSILTLLTGEYLKLVTNENEIYR